MARMDVNRSGEMEVFVRVVELGGFSAAARAFQMTPSAVSKVLSRLEARLGARLIHRSTRKLTLTPEGCAFYERGVRILGEMDSAEREAGGASAPRGKLRVNANVPFGLHHLLPLVPDFLERHPDITLDVVLTDAVVDLLEQRTDVAIRTGALRESRLVARKLGESRMIVVASPAYLKRHGEPKTPADLAAHNRLGFCFARETSGWPFRNTPHASDARDASSGSTTTLPPSGNALVSDGEAMRQLALAGLGIARLATFHVGPDVEARRLVPVLESYNPGEVEPVHAVFMRQSGHLPARVRAFLDYLVAKVRIA